MWRWGPWLLCAACGPGRGADTGALACPSLEAPAEAHLLDATLGEPLAIEVIVGNACRAGGALELTAALYADPGLSLDTASASVPAGAISALTVVFTADGYDARSGTIVLATNDPARPEVAIGVTAAASPDQDGDGQDAIAAGGADCDDGSFAALPGAPEVQDGADNDCDGLVDEDTLTRGDALVAEVMIDPAVTADADGEWIEVANPTDHVIDLVGWQIVDGAGATVTIDASVVVGPGGAVVLAARADANNGGVTPAWTWGPGALTLDQPDGAVALAVAGREISRVAWDAANGVDPGASWGLDPIALRPDRAEDLAWWCPQVTRFGSGDRGTPGAPNDPCRTVDHDGDGQTAASGDCDDDDPTVYEGAAEVPNGWDDDCDELVDEAE